MNAADWTWGNDNPCWLKPRRHIFFIYRRLTNGDIEYIKTPTGRLREWRTRDAVISALRKICQQATS